jgi:hypothetical protein
MGQGAFGQADRSSLSRMATTSQISRWLSRVLEPLWALTKVVSSEHATRVSKAQLRFSYRNRGGTLGRPPDAPQPAGLPRAAIGEATRGYPALRGCAGLGLSS